MIAIFTASEGVHIAETHETIIEPNMSIQKVSGKNPIVAAILTLIFVPLGYFYVGRLKRGIVVTIIGVILAALTFGIGGFVTLIIAIYDAYKLAMNEPAPLDILNNGTWDKSVCQSIEFKEGY